MGKTVRVSQRISSSPYRNARKRKAKNTASTSQELESTTGETILYQRDAPDVTVANDQLNKVAATVTAQLVPEIRGQIIEAVNSFRNSPSTVSSPDSVNQPGHSGITSSSLSVTPIISMNDQLGVNVSQQLRDKIINGEYVDLGALLANSSNEQSNALTLDSNGQITLQPKQTKKINDISMWLDAFLIFTSLYTTAHPDSMQGLLKYMYNVKLGAGRTSGLGWRDYDQQFRLKKAKNPSLSWGIIDLELWLLYMQSSAISQQPSTGLYSTNRKCYEFNNKGRCLIPNCRYLHKCLKCNNPHPAVHCRVQLKNQNNVGQNVTSAARQGTNFRSNARTIGGSNTNKVQDAGRQLPNVGHKEAGKNPN